MLTPLQSRLPPSFNPFTELNRELLDAFFYQLDLNKTEEVISKLERLHQQPHFWDFLLLLPRLCTNSVRAEDVIRAGIHLLQAISK